jgi:hypothetical protein
VNVNDKVSSRVLAYKSQLVVQLRRVLLEEGSVFKARGESNNPYNVNYVGPRGSYVGKTVHDLVCGLKQKVGSVRVISVLDEPFLGLGLGLQGLFPRAPIFTEKYNTCAIVTNAGSLFGSGLGAFIGALVCTLLSAQYSLNLKCEILELIAYFPLIQHGPPDKQNVKGNRQQVNHISLL